MWNLQDLITPSTFFSSSFDNNKTNNNSSVQLTGVMFCTVFHNSKPGKYLMVNMQLVNCWSLIGCKLGSCSVLESFP